MKPITNVFSIVLSITSLLIITGCDDAPKSKIKNPLAGHVEALEKAKDVERQLLEAADKQRKAIDQMSN
ncbi:MAG: hypothetical protein V3U71_05490 [Cocleimonas sp.]